VSAPSRATATAEQRGAETVASSHQETARHPRDDADFAGTDAALAEAASERPSREAVSFPPSRPPLTEHEHLDNSNLKIGAKREHPARS
jgi:hypothetical protein